MRPIFAVDEGKEGGDKTVGVLAKRNTKGGIDILWMDEAHLIDAHMIQTVFHSQTIIALCGPFGRVMP